METKLGALTVKIVEGDICDCEVDAIVNAANNQLWMGGGVAGAIKRRGGWEIEEEAIVKGPIAIGEAVVTGAGALKAKWVIHAAVMGPDLVTKAEYIRRATQAALARAKELGLQSIAFPALGTGVGGFSLEECARIMRESVLEHIASDSTLIRIEFVLFGQPAYQAFTRIFGE